MKPFLVLQMQRMGDMVLSFPLLGWISSVWPGHPLWVIGEQRFFEPLLPLSPAAAYFSYENLPDLRGTSFAVVLNISHRREAAVLAGRLRADLRLGPWQDADGRLFINGDWQLYRASLTHNNRYNLFHWADLNALDCIPGASVLRTAWPLPRSPLARTGQVQEAVASKAAPTQNAVVADNAPARPAPAPNAPTPNSPAPNSLAPNSLAPNSLAPNAPAPNAPCRNASARIGLFLGASQPEKHPDAAFWAGLTRLLLQSGHKPALLGGTAEEALGRAVASSAGTPNLNLCGKFSIGALARFIGELDLLITPDTGPMHIAAWMGTPVLNLSLGPVNPWETGPFSPGHHIVRGLLDCVGCWACAHKQPICHARFTPPAVAGIAGAVLTGTLPQEGVPPRPDSLRRKAEGLEILRSARGRYGLYALETLSPDPADPRHAGLRRRQCVSLFWQAWFGCRFGYFRPEEESAAWNVLGGEFPEQAKALTRGAAEFALLLARTVRRSPEAMREDPEFWKQAPDSLRPLSGYVQMYLSNAASLAPALSRALAMAEDLADRA